MAADIPPGKEKRCRVFYLLWYTR